MYKDKAKQREVQRNWVRQKRAEVQGSTHIIDACDKEHPINFEGRRKDYELLESWANGNGTEYQRRLGVLARAYRPLDFIMTSYLGR